MDFSDDDSKEEGYTSDDSYGRYEVGPQGVISLDEDAYREAIGKEAGMIAAGVAAGVMRRYKGRSDNNLRSLIQYRIEAERRACEVALQTLPKWGKLDELKEIVRKLANNGEGTSGVHMSDSEEEEPNNKEDDEDEEDEEVEPEEEEEEEVPQEQGLELDPQPGDEVNEDPMMADPEEWEEDWDEPELLNELEEEDPQEDPDPPEGPVEWLTPEYEWPSESDDE